MWDTLTHFGITPYTSIVRGTGFWSLRFLCLTLAITPVRWLTGWHSLVKYRRMLGLFGFFYGAVHTVTYVIFNRVIALDPPARAHVLTAAQETVSAIGQDLLRPFFYFGLIALLLMVPLAVTSTAEMIRRLGGRKWQALHRLAYAAAVASILHTYWPLEPRLPRYAVLLGVIFILRIGRAYWKRQAYGVFDVSNVKLT